VSKLTANAAAAKAQIKTLLKPGGSLKKDVRNEKPLVYFQRDDKFWKETEEFKAEKFDMLPSKNFADAQAYVVANHEVLKHWVTGLMAVVAEKIDPELRECCAKAEEWSVLPWSHYGKANQEQIKWWEEKMCDVIVGAAEPDQVVGLPKCETSRAVSAIMTQPHNIVQLAQEQMMPNCTEQDRASINATFFDRETKSLPMKTECIPPNIVVPNQFKKSTLTTCIKDMLNLESQGCSECYSNLVDDMNNNCYETCTRLGAYGAIQTIKETGVSCTRCLWPHLQRHQRCIGGSLERSVNFDDLIHKMIGLGRGTA